MSKPGYTGSKFRRARERAKRNHQVCYRCGQPIDMTLKYPHPQSWTLEHKVPTSLGGGYGYDNMSGSHWICNVSAGNGMRNAKPKSVNSRSW